MSKVPTSLAPTEADIQQLLAAQAHLGTKNTEIKMNPYIWKKRQDGINIINIGKTWEKLVLAARIIATIENPADICVLSARPYGQRAVLKFAQYTGAQAIAGRFTPGTFTNYITKTFREPRLIIVTDPRTDAQAIAEASYVNIPVIALCDTDSPLKHVDVAIPFNNKGKHSIGLAWYLLAREVLRLRGTLSRQAPWDIMVDMFFYRDTEEAEKSEAVDEVVEVGEITSGDNQPEWGAEQAENVEGGEKAAGDDWGAAAEGAADWNSAPVTSGW